MSCRLLPRIVTWQMASAIWGLSGLGTDSTYGRDQPRVSHEVSRLRGGAGPTGVGPGTDPGTAPGTVPGTPETTAPRPPRRPALGAVAGGRGADLADRLAAAGSGGGLVGRRKAQRRRSGVGVRRR